MKQIYKDLIKEVGFYYDPVNQEVADKELEFIFDCLVEYLEKESTKSDSEKDHTHKVNNET